MVICESFYTLQGEGSFIGIPSVFIRTSHCNLRCGWCDTPYTSWWNEGDKIHADEVIERISDEHGFVEHVVISGGEPMIQKDMGELVEKLKKNGHIVTIETNGTIYKEDVKPNLFSISPKLSNSIPNNICYPEGIAKDKTNDEIEKAIDKAKKLHLRNNNLDILEKFVNGECDYQMKFVVQGDQDLKEINDIVANYCIPRNKVYLMPEGFTRELQRQRSLEIAELCKEEKFIFCPRLHVELWGTKRGV
jgi:7-carboxy-7-deazaguanine synthase